MSEDELARQLARSVLDSDTAASFALCDLLLDLRSQQAGLATVEPDTDVLLFAERMWLYLDDPYRRWEAADTIFDQASRWPLCKLFALRRLLASRQPFPYKMVRLTSGRFVVAESRAMSVLSDLWLLWEPSLKKHTFAAVLGLSGAVTPDCVRRLGRRHFSKIEGCGVKTMEQIEKLLTSYGMEWTE